MTIIASVKGILALCIDQQRGLIGSVPVTVIFYCCFAFVFPLLN